MQYRLKYVYIKRGTNASTLYKNVVKIGSVTLKFKKEVCGIFAATGPQFDDRRHLACWRSDTD